MKNWSQIGLNKAPPTQNVSMKWPDVKKKITHEYTNVN